MLRSQTASYNYFKIRFKSNEIEGFVVVRMFRKEIANVISVNNNVNNN